LGVVTLQLSVGDVRVLLRPSFIIHLSIYWMDGRELRLFVPAPVLVWCGLIGERGIDASVIAELLGTVAVVLRVS
jgi:hypothetical protein